jgi:NTE family protein
MQLGLALSGGGALGAAHIGVLESLAAVEIEPTFICGTSAGAIVGLLYAAGGVPMLQGFLTHLIDEGLIPTGPFQLPRPPDYLYSRVEAHLRDLTPATFAALPRRFACVATDIVTGDVVLLTEGNPVDAVLASSAYPGVFSARRIGGQWLVDGGVTRNLPADFVRTLGADFVIGSSLYGLTPLPQQTRTGMPSRIQTALRALEIQQRALSEAHMPFCDFCLRPPVEAFKWYDFNQMLPLREIGRTYADAQREALLALMRESVHT